MILGAFIPMMFSSLNATPTNLTLQFFVESLTEILLSAFCFGRHCCDLRLRLVTFVLIFFPRKLRIDQSALEFLFWFQLKIKNLAEFWFENGGDKFRWIFWNNNIFIAGKVPRRDLPTTSEIRKHPNGKWEHGWRIGKDATSSQSVFLW